jgi:hypothetical protein
MEKNEIEMSIISARYNFSAKRCLFVPVCLCVGDAKKERQKSKAKGQVNSISYLKCFS